MNLLAKLFRIFGKPCDVFRDRLPLSTLDFCDQCNLELNNSAVVENFRRAFAEVVSADPTLVYPQDEAAIFGLNRSDDLATFLFNQGLLRNSQYRYDFPMEDASSVGNIIKVSINLNQ